MSADSPPDPLAPPPARRDMVRVLREAGFTPEELEEVIGGSDQTKHVVERIDGARDAPPEPLPDPLPDPLPAPGRELPLLERAVLALAGACDGAVSMDGAGYNKSDAEIMLQRAEQILKGRKLPRPARADSLRRLRKYSKQLLAHGIKVAEIEAAEEDRRKAPRGNRSADREEPPMPSMEDALALPTPEADGRPHVPLRLRRVVSGEPRDLQYRVRLSDEGAIEASADHETILPPETGATEGFLKALKARPTLADAWRAVVASADPYIFFLRRVEYLVRALAVLATYFREAFFSLPYLDFRSAAAGVGKTTAAQVTAWQSWCGYGTVNPTAAVLCRTVGSSGAVAMVDEVDKLFAKKAENTDVLSLLLSGYRRGLSVSRMNMDVTPPRPEFYDGFQVKIITRRRPVPWELESRCIPFSMVKCGTAKTLAGDPHPTAFREARDLCYAARLLHFEAVRGSYAALLADPPLRDRQGDLYLPLLALARLIDPWLYIEILAEARRDERQRDLAQDPLLGDLLRVLLDLPKNADGVWAVAEITKRLNDLDPDREKPIRSHTVAGLLAGLGFERAPKTTGNRVHYRIDPARLEVWRTTYLQPESACDTPPPPHLTVPNSTSLTQPGAASRKLGGVRWSEVGRGGEKISRAPTREGAEGYPGTCPGCGWGSLLYPGGTPQEPADGHGTPLFGLLCPTCQGDPP